MGGSVAGRQRRWWWCLAQWDRVGWVGWVGRMMVGVAFGGGRVGRRGGKGVEGPKQALLACRRLPSGWRGWWDIVGGLGGVGG